MLSRRASHSSRADETVVLLDSRRDSTPSSAGIDWDNKSGLMSPPFRTTSHFAPSGSPVVAYSDNEKRRDSFKPELGEVSPRQDRFPFKVRRNGRVWERVVIGVLGIALFVVVLGPRLSKSKNARVGAERPLLQTTPLPSFRQNLRDDAGYVTSFAYGGLTNQLLEVFKLVHLGHRLDRAAIIPDLNPLHGEGSALALSTFFVLPDLALASNVSIVEWSDAKLKAATTQTERENLSCWGWKPSDDWSPLRDYKVDTTFWPPPGELTVPAFYSSSFSYPSIEVLVTSDQSSWLDKAARLVTPASGTRPDAPDSQVLCFSHLFYVPSMHFVHGKVDREYTIEELDPEDPVWRDVGRYMHFNRKSDTVADLVLKYFLAKSYSPPTGRTIGIESESRSYRLGHAGTPFIAVHIRRGDFVGMGRADHHLDEYSALVATLQRRVSPLLHPHKLPITFSKKLATIPVIFATDATDVPFLESVKALGWIHLDHTEYRTVEKFGGWYTGILDSLILSRAVGFVGTKQSTFSYVAARRVESWSGGVTAIVGDKPHATSAQSEASVETRGSRGKRASSRIGEGTA